MVFAACLGLILSAAPAQETFPTFFARGGLEAGVLGLPAPVTGGDIDLYAVAHPYLGFHFDGYQRLEIGAALRFMVLARDGRAGTPGNPLIRARDWDELSDFGQILESLRLGKPEQGLRLRAGALGAVTLGHGHVIHRYSNQWSPDYHPAGAYLAAKLDAFSAEVMASDVLGLRLFAAELGLDIPYAMGMPKHTRQGIEVAASFAHDFGRAGGVSPSLSVTHFDVRFGLVRNDKFRFQIVGGAGLRVEPQPAWGGLIGLQALGEPDGYQVRGRFEVRRQGGRYRTGFFGPGYELARFSGIGLTRAPHALEALPTAFSFHGEFVWRRVGFFSGNASFETSLAAEYFEFGRFDADMALSVGFAKDHGLVTLRVLAMGVGQAPRWVLSADFRMRFGPAFFVFVQGGTVYFPEASVGLARGISASLGMGLDFGPQG
ncbi:MAG: hypothetical protein ACKVPX_10240 [Myxococcaceae bacterium]